ncbi:MAG: iron-sulfur cluster-binding protein [Oligoflexales bacterium]|nr:iron-sulfur cluster-binding protein [Oligoflexales bacterium]
MSIEKSADRAEPSLKKSVKRALNDPVLRSNFRGAMDFLIQKRRAAFADPVELEELRLRGESIRQRVVENLPHLLEQLETNCKKNGIHVHWAETGHKACEIVLSILQKHGAGSVVKGKSMVSEEIGLNDCLSRHGIDCLETDMGEYIIQLARERPSHIIMPAIHKSVGEVADLFTKHIPGCEYTEDVDQLILTARRQLREKFRLADAGISGVNFAVAGTGTLVLVENEGNGRLCTTLPDLHIAITGIEKVIPELSDLPVLLKLLTGSSTGQPISTYLNIITSPRKSEEKDGPREVHLVLLDNGRSDAFSDPLFRRTLFCIRCGACMNHCPVYTKIGGHAYPSVYPGPIGKILSHHLIGFEAARDLQSASTLCGACEEVCPVRIPITRTLVKLRQMAAAPYKGRAVGYGRGESFLWTAWQYVYKNFRAYRVMMFFLTRLRLFLPRRPGTAGKKRTFPRPDARTMHELMRKTGERS